MIKHLLAAALAAVLAAVATGCCYSHNCGSCNQCGGCGSCNECGSCGGGCGNCGSCNGGCNQGCGQCGNCGGSECPFGWLESLFHCHCADSYCGSCQGCGENYFCDWYNCPPTPDPCCCGCYCGCPPCSQFHPLPPRYGSIPMSHGGYTSMGEMQMGAAPQNRDTMSR
jgi:hypothetical protein